MSETIYWIWIQQALKYAGRKAKMISEVYDDIEKFYIGGEREWRLSGIFNSREIEILTNTPLEKAREILLKCHELQCDAIGLDDHRFPYLLKQIDNPPAAIYVKGDIECLNSVLSIAVVGTRKASDYGAAMAEEISSELSKSGAVIVSGGAMGIDSISHESALRAGGKTVCVLGCGINYPYLSGKEYLKRKIANSGAIISEYPPDTPAYRANFPIRNRIISGLSLGTIVVEAGEKSGSLITANLANEQNRDVYIVPPLAENLFASGSTLLIRDGAQVISSAREVLDEYKFRKSPKNSFAFRSQKVSKKSFEFKNPEQIPALKIYSEPKAAAKDLAKLSKSQKEIYDLISGEKIHIDKLAEKSGEPVYKLLSILTELELFGLIKSLPGKYYEVV